MAPQAERAHYHHGDLRNALLAEAARLVAERGVEGFSLREAARGVGVSPTAAYRHFADKGALLWAVAQEGFARLSEAMEEAMGRVRARPGSAAHAAGRLAALGGAYVEFAVRHTAHFRVMFGPWARPGAMGGAAEHCAMHGSAGEGPFGLLVQGLDQLVAAGVLTPEARVGGEVVAWSAVHGLASLVADGPLELSDAERTSAILQVTRAVLLGLGADPRLLPRRPVHLDLAAASAPRRG